MFTEDLVNRQEFEELRDLPGKEVVDDIVYREEENLPEGVFCIDSVRVANALGHDVIVEGFFHRAIKRVSFTFVLAGTGPICRFEVNGPIHGNAGRTHKHDLCTDRCPEQNLPHVTARPDLNDLGPSELWQRICKLARIDHTGSIVLP